MSYDPIRMLGLRFQIGVGSIIENTQIVFISESLNDFTPGVNIRTAPHVAVSIEVTRDKYLASYVSDQVWQISGGEVVVAWDADRKNSDGCTTQSHLHCCRNNLLKLTQIGDMPVRVSAHRSLNYAKGVVRFRQAAQDLTNET